MKQEWSHQPPAIEYLNNHRNSMLAAHMGTGKSFMQIANVKHIASHPGAKTLVLCPSAVMGVWRREFFLHATEQFDVLVLDKKSMNASKKAQLIHEAFKVQQSHRRPLVVVINFESFWLPAIIKVLSAVVWDKIVADEIHRLKSHSAQCSRHAWKLGWKAGSKTGLTGTPMPNDPGDIFAQYRFLDDRIFGRFWGKFKDHYAVMNKWIPQKVDKWINLEELHRKIDTIMYRIGSEVLVLPDKQDIMVEVNLSPAGYKIYAQMLKESMALIERIVIDQDYNEDKEFHTAVGTNGAVQFLRLLQLAQGYVTDDEGDAVNTDTEKRKVLLDLIQDAGEPVCVYGWFKHDLACVERCCEIAGLRYGELSGRRKDLTPHAKMPDDIDVMGVQCKSGSAGIDLTRARIGIILNSGLLSHGDFGQMIARQYRPGQTRNVVFYHLVSKRTVETKLITERGKKRSIVDVLMTECKDIAEEVF